MTFLVSLQSIPSSERILNVSSVLSSRILPAVTAIWVLFYPKLAFEVRKFQTKMYKLTLEFRQDSSKREETYILAKQNRRSTSQPGSKTHKRQEQTWTSTLSSQKRVSLFLALLWLLNHSRVLRASFKRGECFLRVQELFKSESANLIVPDHLVERFVWFRGRFWKCSS